MELLAECARDKVGMGENWNPYIFKCLPEHPQEPELVQITGAVAPLKTRGKNEGHPNWDKMDKATIRTAYITLKEHAEWVKAWEQKTGQCAECKGTGQALAGWSVTEGTKYRDCGKCRASGKSNAGSDAPGAVEKP